MSDCTETITRDELKAALKAGVLDGRGYPSTGADRNAGLIVEHAKTHREPEYLDNEPYVDAYGNIWCYQAGTEGTRGEWVTVGSPIRHIFERPGRPLKRLVPEG